MQIQSVVFINSSPGHMAPIMIYKEHPEYHILKASRLGVAPAQYQTFNQWIQSTSPIYILVSQNNELHYSFALDALINNFILQKTPLLSLFVTTHLETGCTFCIQKL